MDDDDAVFRILLSTCKCMTDIILAFTFYILPPDDRVFSSLSDGRKPAEGGEDGLVLLLLHHEAPRCKRNYHKQSIFGSSTAKRLRIAHGARSSGKSCSSGDKSPSEALRAILIGVVEDVVVFNYSGGTDVCSWHPDTVAPHCLVLRSKTEIQCAVPSRLMSRRMLANSATNDRRLSNSQRVVSAQSYHRRKCMRGSWVCQTYWVPRGHRRQIPKGSPQHQPSSAAVNSSPSLV